MTQVRPRSTFREGGQGGCSTRRGTDGAPAAARRGAAMLVPPSCPPASTMSRVVPAMSVTMARSVPLSALRRLDLPTLGRPTSATWHSVAQRDRPAHSVSKCRGLVEVERQQWHPRSMALLPAGRHTHTLPWGGSWVRGSASAATLRCSWATGSAGAPPPQPALAPAALCAAAGPAAPWPACAAAAGSGRPRGPPGPAHPAAAGRRQSPACSQGGEPSTWSSGRRPSRDPAPRAG
jgi:hypothetical protein